MCRFKVVLLYCIFILSVVCCENKNTRFNKTQYLESCGLSIEQMLLPEQKEDSLFVNMFRHKYSLDVHLRNELLYENNLQSCKNLLLVFDENKYKYGFVLSKSDSLLINHYYAKGLYLAESPNDVIGLTLSFARSQSRETQKRIGEVSYPYTKSLNDTLSYQCITLIISSIIGAEGGCLIGLDKDDMSEQDAEQIKKWSEKGLHYSESIFGHFSKEYGEMLDRLSYCSWKLNTQDFGTCADSLIAYMHRGNEYDFVNRFNGALYDRYLELLRGKNYERAGQVLDLFCPSFDDTYSTYLPLKTLLPNRLRGDYHEPVNVDSSNVFIAVLNRDVIWLLSAAGDRGDINRSTMCFFEKARLCYLDNVGNYSTWLNRAFYEGALNTFPSSAHKYIDNYIRPEYQYNQGLINLLTLQYNNDSPESVYDALLFIKGASETIPPEIYNSIKNNAPREIIEYVDSIRTYGIQSRLGQERDYLENEIGPNIKDVLLKNISSYSDIQKSLSRDAAAIEFYAVPSFDPDNNNYYYRAAILTSDNERPIIVNLCSDNKIRDILFNKNLYSSKEAFNAIWAPIEQFLIGKKVIYYSMDRLLNILNLQALLLPDKTRLNQKYHLIQLSSTKEILADNSSSPYKSIALFGGIDYNAGESMASKNNIYNNSVSVDRSILQSFKRNDFRPLPYSKKEIDDIADCATNKNLIIHYFSSRNGTEEAFKQLSGRPLSILHIATHGFYYSKSQSHEIDYFKELSNQDNPMKRCGLLLAGSRASWQGLNVLDNEDGILLGDEIAKLDFSNVDLVVLSACKSALGDINSEGVVGLRQAFKRAGAKSILLTLNNIDDKATAYFMSLFYNHLFETGDKYDSFNHAITGMKSSKDYSNPDYWAHFVLID